MKADLQLCQSRFAKNWINQLFFVQKVVEKITVAGIEIAITRKKIRNLNLRISLPDAEVKVSAPWRYSVAHIEKFIWQKIDWIKKSRDHVLKLRDAGKIILPKKFISGEEHYFCGEKFILEVVQNSSSNRIQIEGNKIYLQVKNLSNFAQRQKIFDDFYRASLREKIPPLIAKYEIKMNTKVKNFGIKKMKTRYGTCNIEARRIWLSLELAKRTPQFLESVVVHEMVHFFERRHNKNFYDLMNKFMPDWRRER